MEDKDKVTAAIERLNELGRTDLAMAICNAIANRDEELSEARRLLDEAGRQEPALFIAYKQFGGGYTKRYLTLRDTVEAHRIDGYEITPLYTAPVPAQPAVPDGKFHVPTLEAVLCGLKSEDDSTQLRAIISEVETMLAASKEDGTNG